MVQNLRQKVGRRSSKRMTDNRHIYPSWPKVGQVNISLNVNIKQSLFAD